MIRLLRYKKIILGTILCLGLYLLILLTPWYVEKIQIPQYSYWKKNPQTTLLFKNIIAPDIKKVITKLKNQPHHFLSWNLTSWQDELMQLIWVKNIVISRELPTNWVLDIELRIPTFHLVYEKLPLFDSNANEQTGERVRDDQNIQENQNNSENNLDTQPAITHYIGDANELKEINNAILLKNFLQYQTQPVISIKIEDFAEKPNPLILKQLTNIHELWKKYVDSSFQLKQITYNKIGFVTADVIVYDKKELKSSISQTIYFGFLHDNQLLQQPQKLIQSLQRLNVFLLKTSITAIPLEIKMIK